MGWRARGKAAAVLAESVGSRVPRPFAAAAPVREVTLDGVVGDLYDAGPSAAPILLLPGAAPKGRHDPRVQQVSRALARAGRVVFVPDLELSRTTFDRVDLDRIVRSVVALHDRTSPGRRVAVLGFSYGGAFALVAAADARAQGRIAIVSTFGSYFDLVGVLQAATTGRATIGATTRAWQPHEKARDIVREVVLRLVDPIHVEPLRAAFDGADPTTLAPEARSAYDLAVNTDPARTAPLAAGLDARARGLLTDFSPVTVADRITVPVVALHSEDDPLVPYAELLRLRAGLPSARTMTVTSFKHVDFTAGGSRVALVKDVLTAWRFTAALLAADSS